LGSLTGGDNLVVPPRISECCRKAFEAGGHWEPRAKEMLLKLYGATLDEAVALLDQAEKQLCGHSQSNLWWSRLHTLRLRVYGLLGELGDSAAMSLSLRKFAPDIGIYTNFTSALRISRNDDFRKLRAIRYFLSANRWHFRFTKSMERTKDPLSTLLPDTMDKALVAFRQIWKKHEPSEGYESLLANDPSSPKPDWRGKLDEHRFETAICRLAFDYGLEHFKAKEAPS